jgi:hypothetical protein
LTLDAFITKGGRVVYLTSHGEALQGALKGSQLCEHILATIVWHEMAHIDGANEAEAQRREEQLWTAFVMEERVDRIQGLRYLTALKTRRGDAGQRRTPQSRGDSYAEECGPVEMRSGKAVTCS